MRETKLAAAVFGVALTLWLIVAIGFVAIPFLNLGEKYLLVLIQLAYTMFYMLPGLMLSGGITFYLGAKNQGERRMGSSSIGAC